MTEKQTALADHLGSEEREEEGDSLCFGSVDQLRGGTKGVGVGSVEGRTPQNILHNFLVNLGQGHAVGNRRQSKQWS